MEHTRTVEDRVEWRLRGREPGDRDGIAHVEW